MVTGAYYPEISGGGLQCRTLVRALRDQIAFTVLTTTRDGTLSPEEEIDGVPVYRCVLDVRRPLSKLSAGFRLAWLFWRLRRRFQIVHLHGFSQKSYLFLFLGRLARRKLVLKMTSVGRDDPVSIRNRSRLAGRFYAQVDCVVSVSPRLSEAYAQAGLPLTHLRIIPNGVDTTRFRPPTVGERVAFRRALGLAEDRPIILFVGFFSREKCPDLLLEAWVHVRHNTPARPMLVFVGATKASSYEVDQELVARILAKARALNAESELVFVERTSEVERYYQAADFFVLPSVREGLPNVLLEAMATGLACAATDLPGVTDWVIRHNENGLLFPPRDVVALSRQLQQLLADGEQAKRFGDRARTTILQRFSIQQIGEEYLGLYTSLPAGR